MLRKIAKVIPVLLLLIFVLAFYIRPLIGLFYTGEIEMELTESSIVVDSLITLFILIATPLTWMYLIDRKSLGESLRYLKIGRENLDLSIAYGIFAFFLLMFVLLILAMIIKELGMSESNPVAKEIAKSLSIPSIVFLAIFQSSGEEVFFRGFLLEKLSFKGNYNIGIILSSTFFGLAHMSYEQIWQVVVPILIGIIFGYTVVKSKNLLSSIIPHVSYNLLSLLAAHFISLTL